MKILLLEDDSILSDLMSEHFVSLGYSVDTAMTGDEALERAESSIYDIFIFDINVPKISGLDVLKTLREYKNSTPTIIITAYQDLKHLKKGFENQCDDYIKKPFELEELEQRVNNIKRHFYIESEKIIKIDDNLEFISDKKILKKDGINKSLSAKECDILSYFITHRGRTISGDELIQNLWTYEDMPSDATLRVYIKTLRKAVGRDKIKTIRGMGYCFE